MLLSQIIFKTSFVVASIFGVIGAIIALATSTLPRWALILFMISSLAFFVTFATALLSRDPIVTKTTGFALVLFSAASYGSFVSALEVYLMSPDTPFVVFLRLSLVPSVLLAIGSFGLLYDVITNKAPKLMFIHMITGATLLFVASVLSYFSLQLAYEISTLIAFTLLLVASILNLLV